SSSGDPGDPEPDPDPEPEPDTVPPAATITSPAAGATVEGAVTVTVSASDDTAVAMVELLIDGAVASTTVSAPYTFTWDTSGLSAGDYVLTARARDAAGNVGVSPAVAVTVAEPDPEPEPEPQPGLPSPWTAQDIGD